MESSESVPTNPDLSTLSLGGFDDAALNIASYLSAQSILALHQVNQGWNSLLNKHDEVLFEQLIHHDFIEGYVLNYVAERDKLSYKKLYLAFYNRWSLPDEGGVDVNISITWQPGYINRNDIDIKSMVFIARLGSYDGDDALYDENSFWDKDKSCVLLHWKEVVVGNNPNNYKLVIDKDWDDTENGFQANQNKAANKEFYENQDLSDFEYALQRTHTLTLHAIDIKQYRVATLMEENQMSSLSQDEDPESLVLSMEGYGDDVLPKLYGIPRKSSPYYRDFNREGYRYEGFTYLLHKGVEEMSISGAFHCYQAVIGLTDENGDEVDGSRYLAILPNHNEDGEGITFCFGNQRPPHEVCSFLNGLMEEKCVVGERSPVIHETSAIVAQQPDWVQENIVDTITSYASFEDQAGKLRLVCRQFGKSALKQLKGKLEKQEVIGSYTIGQSGNNFIKATVRSGWSETCLTSKESAVEDAIWLTKCRCEQLNLCGDKDSCPNKDKPLRYTRNNGGTKTFSKTHLIREKLLEDSSFKVSQGYGVSSPCKCECFFKQEVMSIYQICDKFICNKRMPKGPKSDHSRQLYGVSTERLYTKRFIRSLFLALANVSDIKAKTSGEEQPNKRARIARNEEIKMGMAEATSRLDQSDYSRSLTIFRFYSANNDQKEICIEYYSKR